MIRDYAPFRAVIAYITLVNGLSSGKPPLLLASELHLLMARYCTYGKTL